MNWGIQSGGLAVVSLNGPCPMVRGISETRLEAIVRLTLIQGGILTAFGIGVVGVLRSHAWLVFAASAIFFLESIPLVFDGFFILTLPPACYLAWIAMKVRKPTPLFRA